MKHVAEKRLDSEFIRITSTFALEKAQKLNQGLVREALRACVLCVLNVDDPFRSQRRYEMKQFIHHVKRALVQSEVLLCLHWCEFVTLWRNRFSLE